MDIQGRTFILTGGKRMGSAIAMALHEKGANIVVTYRESKEDAQLVVAQVESLGGKALAVKADLSSEEEINKLVETVKKEFGTIDGLVHLAAPYPKTPLGKIEMNQVDSINRSIVGSAIMLAQAVIPEIRKNKGKIIFFSDWSVLQKPFENYLVYNAAKAGINSITKGLARELAPDVCVNAIAPGPMIRPADLTDKEDSEALAGTPLGRWGGEEEIAKAVMYLLDADFVTGIVLPVDGGRSVA